MPMESRSIRFPAELWVRLEQVAKEEDRALSWVVREACERFLSAAFSIPELTDRAHRDAVAGLPKVDTEKLAKSRVAYTLTEEPDEDFLAPKVLDFTRENHVCEPKWVASVSRYRCSCGRTEAQKW